MLLSLFFTFFKIGLFTFGGGYAMIAQIQEAVITQKHWLNEEELMDVITIAESTPGPIAINLATFVGYKTRGLRGSILATLGIVLPSMSIIFLISLFFQDFMRLQYVRYAFVGIKCAVALLILRAGLDMLRKLEKKPLPLLMCGFVCTAMLVLELCAVSFSSIYFILLGGLTGLIVYALLESRNVEGHRP